MCTVFCFWCNFLTNEKKFNKFGTAEKVLQSTLFSYRVLKENKDEKRFSTANFNKNEASCFHFNIEINDSSQTSPYSHEHPFLNKYPDRV